MAKVRKSRHCLKTESQGPRLHTAPEYFENAFYKCLGQHPLEWVRVKMEGGSDIGAVSYLYEISASEIARMNNCVAVSFEYYHSRYLETMEKPTMSNTSKTVYYKLVRDRIPEIIEASGRTCSYETLTDKEYIAKLDAKLNEELAEYQKSKSLEELADLLEVLGAVVKARGYTWNALTALRKKKREDCGGFEKRILLKEVYEDVGDQEKAPQAAKLTASLKNAGQLWTESEEEKLLDEFDSHMLIADIAREHGRSIAAIESRLIRLGRISRVKDGVHSTFTKR